MITEKELFEDIISLCDSGWHDLSSDKASAAGEYLEEILGLEKTNHDGPDAGVWELKCTTGTSLLTLFHKTPRPQGSIYSLINQHGYEGRNGRPSMRFTIRGSSPNSRDLYVDDDRDNNMIHICYKSSETRLLHWTYNDLLNSAGSKLRRLILVKCTRRNGQVKYEEAMAFEQVDLLGFIDAIVSGTVVVDFDAYIKNTGAIRDHGTKFRIHPSKLYLLYEIWYSIVP